HIVPRIEKTCESCGKKFHVKPGRERRYPCRFCSWGCHNSAQTIPVAKRFNKFVDPPDKNGCMLWNGAITGSGYGLIITRSDNTRVSSLAHRVSWELAKGSIPDGLWVLHRCDIRHCVNPDHLFLGTHKDNMQDAVSKNRIPRGENHCCAKVKDKDAIKLL